MSSRLYPLYQRGNPQLRVFLPNFVMKLVKPRDPQPANVVQFQVSVEMTKFDIKNYLEKIYNIPVENIVTHVRMGKFSRSKIGKYVIKDDDYKVVYVTLGIMAILFLVKSPAFIEDLNIPEEAHHSAPAFIEALDKSYKTTALNCGIAAGMYVITLIISGWQVMVNKRS
ncbi:39S ribosomal protein L23, mitochondrial [Chionoecetes opilio]|uniref:Large ribosomal subunit protein uL23m n=1 Tax=Chionoecetes opilio TaxID=41210 RepID=A0A8J4Y3G8_CHIOP|nr:39S ribosomal protein L23, mitochondrial [Chionoecetes opilio]